MKIRSDMRTEMMNEIENKSDRQIASELLDAFEKTQQAKIPFAIRVQRMLHKFRIHSYGHISKNGHVIVGKCIYCRKWKVMNHKYDPGCKIIVCTVLLPFLSLFAIFWWSFIFITLITLYLDVKFAVEHLHDAKGSFK